MKPNYLFPLCVLLLVAGCGDRGIYEIASDKSSGSTLVLNRYTGSVSVVEGNSLKDVVKNAGGSDNTTNAATFTVGRLSGLRMSVSARARYVGDRYLYQVFLRESKGDAASAPDKASKSAWYKVIEDNRFSGKVEVQFLDDQNFTIARLLIPLYQFTPMVNDGGVPTEFQADGEQVISYAKYALFKNISVKWNFKDRNDKQPPLPFENPDPN